MRFVRHASLILAALAMSAAGVALAQGSFLAYGQSVTGSLSSSAPLTVYVFQGEAGDQVTAQAVAITSSLDLTLSIISPAGQPLVTGASDPFSPFAADARVSASLPQTGVYTLLVADANGQSGDYLVRLTGARMADLPLPAAEAPPQLDFAAGSGPQTFAVSAGPDTPASVAIVADSFAVAVEIRDSAGQLVAFLAGVPAASVTVPAGQVYLVTITPIDPASSGSVTVSVSDAAPQTTLAPAPPPPATTPEVGPGAVTDDACIVAAASAVNVRSGPGTNYSILTQLLAGQQAPALGVNSGWYLVNVAGAGQGWVSASVVTSRGNCASLPSVAAPPAQPGAPTATTAGQQPPALTATYTPSPTSAQPVAPTATYTASATTAGQQPVVPTATYTPSPTSTEPAVAPTATYTTTFTPTPPVPTAPPDANFNAPLVIALDSTASSTDFVSYPEGDREDRVRYDITGMNTSPSLPGGRARLIITASCFGTGTQNIQFFTGGQTFACGQTVVDREVTADSRTGTITITAVGGDNTYVQWVLTGTATRVN